MNKYDQKIEKCEVCDGWGFDQQNKLCNNCGGEGVYIKDKSGFSGLGFPTYIDTGQRKQIQLIKSILVIGFSIIVTLFFFILIVLIIKLI